MQNVISASSKVTRALATATKRPMKIDEWSNIQSIEADNILFERDRKKMKSSISVGSHKILTLINERFKRNLPNNSKNIVIEDINVKYLKVNIKINELAEILGKKDDKNFRKELRYYLLELRRLEVTGEEKVKGKIINWKNGAFISSAEIKNNSIEIILSPQYAQSIANSPYTQYPREIFNIDNRNDNAYKIALKLSEYYHMKNNISNGRNNKIKVKNVIEITNLPTIEAVRTAKQGYESRIIKPFIKVLDSLITDKIIKSYEITNTADYNEFMESYLIFEM